MQQAGPHGKDHGAAANPTRGALRAPPPLPASVGANSESTALTRIKRPNLMRRGSAPMSAAHNTVTRLVEPQAYGHHAIISIHARRPDHGRSRVTIPDIAHLGALRCSIPMR